MSREEREQHPSYGMIGFNRVQATGTTLVGSEFRHQHFVTLRIHRAERHRDLSNDWWFSRECLIEVSLSEAQFVELIARPNTGDGVPCTLEWIMGETMPDPPEPKPIRERYRADMKHDAEECVKDLRVATTDLQKAVDQGKINKTILRDIIGKLESAACSVDRGIPFVEEQFEEAMEATTRHAAAEIEATVTQTAIRLGLDQMRQIAAGAPKLIDGPKEDQ